MNGINNKRKSEEIRPQREKVAGFHQPVHQGIFHQGLEGQLGQEDSQGFLMNGNFQIILVIKAHTGHGEVVPDDLQLPVQGQHVLSAAQAQAVESRQAPDGAVHLLRANRESMPADGRSVVQVEIEIRDAAGRVVPDQDRNVRLTVEGGDLLGMDNGLSSDRTEYRTGERSTYRGLAFAVIRAPRVKKNLRIRAEAEGVPSVSLDITLN